MELRKFRAALSRAAIIPFETAIAALVVISGIAGLAKFGIADPISALVPGWEYVTLNLMYMLAGFGMAAGICLDKGRAEGFGLWLLSGAVIAGFFLLANSLGINRNFFFTWCFEFVIL